MDVTIKTKHTDGNGQECDRNVTLWLNPDSSVSLLGGLTHGTRVIINQKLIDDLQDIVNKIEESTHPYIPNQCDYGHDTKQKVKRLPTGGDSAVIVCYSHYLQEITFRRARNKELSESCKFDLPSWESLEVYPIE